MKKWVVLFILIIFLLLLFCPSSKAWNEDEIYQPRTLTVTTTLLNGRYRPDKHSTILAEYLLGDKIEPTGKWSKDHNWIEVNHSEVGLIWVNINYVSERMDIFTVYTLSDQKIKVRSSPVTGKVKKYIKKEQPIEISQVIMGYGRCEWGWVDLGYFIEDCE